MGFFSNLFGKNDKTAKENSEKLHLSKNVGVPYNNDLIKILRKDHENLINEFGKIAKAAQNKKYKTLKQYMKTFKVNLEIHNYSEKIQLFLYLKNYYKDSEYEDFIEDMSKSAEEIYKDVFNFLKKYENIEFNDQYLGLFKSELEAVGRILQSRIEVEESELYTLYKK